MAVNSGKWPLRELLVRHRKVSFVYTPKALGKVPLNMFSPTSICMSSGSTSGTLLGMGSVPLSRLFRSFKVISAGSLSVKQAGTVEVRVLFTKVTLLKLCILHSSVGSVPAKPKLAKRIDETLQTAVELTVELAVEFA